MIGLKVCNWRVSGGAPSAQTALLLHGNVPSICSARLTGDTSRIWNRSLSLWAKLYPYTPSGNMRYSALFTLCGNASYGSIGYSGDNFFVRNSGEVDYQQPGLGLRTLGYVEFGEWFHIAMSVSGGVHTFYLNGVQVDRWTGKTFSYDISSPALALGSMPWNDGNTYDCANGMLANVNMADRALSASEIASISSGVDAEFPNPTHAWRFAKSSRVASDVGSVGGWDVPLGSAAEVVEI